jgi:hypothetical protein
MEAVVLVDIGEPRAVAGIRTVGAAVVHTLKLMAGGGGTLKQRAAVVGVVGTQELRSAGLGTQARGCPGADSRTLGTAAGVGDNQMKAVIVGGFDVAVAMNMKDRQDGEGCAVRSLRVVALGCEFDCVGIIAVVESQVVGNRGHCVRQAHDMSGLERKWLRADPGPCMVGRVQTAGPLAIPKQHR